MNKLNAFRREEECMEAQHLRDLRADLPTTSRHAPSRAQRKYFWIDEDEELTPTRPRKETPLSAWS